MLSLSIVQFRGILLSFMTYCVAFLLDESLSLAPDTRFNAGVNLVAIYASTRQSWSAGLKKYLVSYSVQIDAMNEQCNSERCN